MSLDLGALVAHVVVDSAAAEGRIAALLKSFGELGARAEAAGTGAAVLDRELVSVATAATQAAAGLDRAAGASRTSAKSEDEAAAAATAHARAVARVAEVMTPLANATAREQAAALRLVAAQERLNAVQESGVATTRQLAGAQASVITAQRGVAGAQAAAAAGSSRWATALGGVVKTAGALGLIVGVLAAAKGAIDITKEANSFQRDMVTIQTNADVTAAEVNKASGALLDMAGPVAAGPADLALAFYHAKSVGLDYAKALDTTKIAAEGAKIGHGDLEQTMNALTSTVASGIPGVENMSGAMGQLIAIVGTGDMKLSDLNQALGSGILTVVKGYGLSLTDVGAALATFGDNNIRGADAATMLRMAVQAMAVPAKAGRDRLEELGLASDTLAKDMQTGGLNKAILDLKAHLDAAGITSVQVGAILTEVFGKRAGPGIAVLVGQVDRLESKFAILRDSGASFGDKWTATTQTASFALSRFGHMLEAAGIQLTEKLGPGIASVVGWLTVNLPHAVSVLQSILSPFEHEVGVVLVGAWHGLVGVLSVAETAISGIARGLEAVKGPITDVATVVLTMWAAFKAYTIATAAIGAARLALSRLAATAPYALAAVGKSASTLVAGLSPAMVAITAISLVLGAAILHSNKHSDALARERNEMDQLTDAIKSDSGALGANTREVVKNALGASGAFAAARNLHLSLSDVTDAAMDNAAALARVREQAGLTATMQRYLNGLSDQDVRQLKNSSSAQDKRIYSLYELNSALGENNKAVKDAVQSAKDKAAADKTAADAAGNLVPKTAELTQHQKDLNQANKEVQVVMNGITYAMQGQTTAADRLSNALDTLSGKTLSAMQAELQLKDAAASGPAGSTPSGPAPGTLTSAQGSSESATNRHARAVEALAIAQTKYDEAVKKGNADAIAAAHLRLAKAQDAVAAASDAMTAASQRLSGAQGKVAAANKGVSSSLSENSAAGRTNIEWILGMITTANQHATAVMKQTNSIDTSIAALKNDEATIRSAAAAHGIYGKALDNLLAKTEAKPGDLLKLLKSQADQAGTHALALQKKLDNLAKQRLAVIRIGDHTGEASKHIQDQLDVLTQPRTIPIKFLISEADLKNRLAGAIINGIGLNAEGTDNWRGGLTWVGEKGPELLDLPKGSRITSHAKSVALPVAPPAVAMPMSAAAVQAVPSLHAGNIAGALHGMRIVIDAGSVGTLTGFVDSRVDGTLGRASRTSAARQSRADAFGRT